MLKHKVRVMMEDIFKPAGPEELAQRTKDKERMDAEQAERERLEREHEKAEGRAVAKKKSLKIQKISKLLGFPKVKEDINDWSYSVNVTGTNSIGDSIHISFRDGRFNISGDYPRSRDNRWIAHVQDENGQEIFSPAISVSPEKTVEQVVAEVNRRFMPYFTRRLSLVKQTIEKENSYEDLTLKNLQDIKGSPLTDWEKREKKIQPYSDNYYGDIIAGGDDINLRVSHINVDQAKRILAIIRGGNVKR